MLRRLAATAALISIGCGGTDPTTSTTPITSPDPTEPFPTPWEAADPLGGRLDGWFFAEIGSELPGGGWFSAPGASGHDHVTAALHPVEGAAWPVLQIRLAGLNGAGWDTLELDVALNHWVAGQVPIDGEAAVGLLCNADGRQRYVVGGVLEVAAAGVEDGQWIEASFDDLQMAEVLP